MKFRQHSLDHKGKINGWVFILKMKKEYRAYIEWRKSGVIPFPVEFQVRTPSTENNWSFRTVCYPDRRKWR